MVAQGFDLRDFVMTESGSPGGYAILNRLAGNSMTTSVLGAAIFGIMTHILPIGKSGRPIKQAPCPCAGPAMDGDGDEEEHELSIESIAESADEAFTDTEY